MKNTMKNTKKANLRSQFHYTRVLGKPPILNPSLEWSGYLGYFTDIFGPAEFDIRGESIIVYWNFVDLTSDAPQMFSCYAMVPANRRLTRDVEIDVAITGGYAEKRDTFASRFMDHEIDVRSGNRPPLFFSNAKLIPVISTPSIPAHA